ncbi:cholesterol oxidase [Intrasporangium chromatireducens Q5-1]|uniref:Cholesterol oxidase n=1 Tax=Intrasporangium chromatireducens Q5-1 TaxID=584657 RepID=W9GM48_9MICO|nr:GMC family oxidoreductase [Intrasporangium chromatireducens]EWT07336.1 cholesterol oxidase [Intrasporangium chromatireducens Q5-1]
MSRAHDHDVIVIGSGFGGSVAALRLAEKGYDVLVYEAGRRFADEDFARTSWDLRRYLWAPALGCYGVQRIHRLPHCLVLAGAGVGGGSLNYAQTLYVPPKPFFTDPQWSGITDWEAELAPHYATAQRMLGVVENPCDGPVERLMRDTAVELGTGASFRRTPVGVFFGEPGRRVPDPYFGGEGPDRTGCTQCGNCMVGCRVGAKNTLVKNYLALAERRGVVIEPLRTVTSVRPLDPAHPDEGYAVHTVRTDAHRRGRRDPRAATARHVVVAAGAWGTAQLLQTLKATALPGISDRLGWQTRTNSEALGGAMTVRVPRDVDLTRGVAITSSFHVDETTHVENVRYGKGSNAMGLLAVMQVDGGGRVPRPVRFLASALRHPGDFARSLSVRRWSERTVIALVMQTVDNSIVVSRRRGWFRWHLTSEQGHGEPNPTWIPQGNRAVRALARGLERATGERSRPGSSIGEILDIPMTAHFLGGAVIAESPDRGVVDPYQRLWGYPGISVVDGSTVSANLGVNPALTITAQAERAMALWPRRGEPDRRPKQGEPYVRLTERVAAGADG